jgi:hypothetical protein
MQVAHARCCGLDVHQKTVVACVLLTNEQGQVQREVHTFGTMTADLLALADWLAQQEVTSVAMESTGVYVALPNGRKSERRRRCAELHPSEIMAILITFHGSHNGL